MIDFEKKDYLVVKKANKTGYGFKPMLIRVTGSNPEEVTGRVEVSPHIKNETLTVPATDIILNLGRHPTPGKVYGFDLKKLYRGKSAHDEFGEIYYFTQPDEQNKARFLKALDTSASILKKHRLGFVVSSPFLFEVVPKNGKYAGMYHHSSKEGVLSRVMLSVSDETLEGASLNNYTYVILHELGHLIHFTYLGGLKKLNSKWVELFSKTIAPRTVTASRCKELGVEAFSLEEGVKGLYASSDDDVRNELRLISKWLREVKNVSAKEIDLLIASNAKETFKTVWPKVDVHSKKLSPTVSEYACKSWRELFAEAFAFHLLGKKLPANVEALMEESLTAARRSV